MVAVVFEDETPFAGVEITVMRGAERDLQRVVDLPRRLRRINGYWLAIVLE